MNLRLISSVFFWLIALLFSPVAFSSQDITYVVNANNQFSFDLYAKYKTKDRNIFFSPYSISSALAMAYEGSKGKTREEIQQVLHFQKDGSSFRQAFQALHNRINSNDAAHWFKTAYAIWGQKGFKFLGTYLNVIEQYYAGIATSLDFAEQPESSRLTINNWVEEQTNGKIKNSFPKGAFDKRTRLVITNAIYFKDSWLFEFNKKDTEVKDFYLENSDTVKVKMMGLTGKHFNYVETDDLQILELRYRYQKNQLSMLILLPKDNTLKAVEDSLTVQRLTDWKKSLTVELVDVHIPKLKFETKYFMAKDLQELGMTTAFSDEQDKDGYFTKADFSGMTGEKNLNINQVVHQAFVDVNEEGTEAAAATGEFLDGASAIGDFKKSKLFNADHPFIFIIQDRETGNILFLGRILNPNNL